MNHPSELLADLMDGTLDADARARVEAHLSTCPTCREDLAAAAAGRDALRALGPASTPTDLPDRVKAAAAGGDAGHTAGAPAWYRWAGVAAAAALVAVIAFSLPDIGGGPAADRAGGFESVGSAVGTASEEGVPLELHDDVDYGQEDLEELASQARTLTAGGVAEAPEVDAPADATGQAAACVTGAFEGQPSGQIVRLIRARFQGRRAYVAVYLEGPGADQAPDTATVWVAALDDCTILSFAQARI
jgi:anti-sigma factor RsiW